MRCRYSWDFPVLGQMIVLALPGSNVILPVTWSMTAQSSPTGSTRDTVLLGVEGGVLIFATWFAMRSCTWRQLDRVLYPGLVSSRIMWGTRWGGFLGARPGWNAM